MVLPAPLVLLALYKCLHPFSTNYRRQTKRSEQSKNIFKDIQQVYLSRNFKKRNRMYFFIIVKKKKKLSSFTWLFSVCFNFLCLFWGTYLKSTVPFWYYDLIISPIFYFYYQQLCFCTLFVYKNMASNLLIFWLSFISLNT